MFLAVEPLHLEVLGRQAYGSFRQVDAGDTRPVLHPAPKVAAGADADFQDALAASLMEPGESRRYPVRPYRDR